MIGQQFPDLELRGVERLGSGWEYDVYLIDDRLVIRFPRYAEVADGLDRAEAVLEFVCSELGSAVTVPRIELRGEPDSLFPHRFFGHELIPGVPAAEHPDPLSTVLASDLGRALTHIHAISVERASRLGLPSQKWDCRSAFDALLDVIQAVPEVSDVVPEGAAWARELSEIPAEYAGPARVIHDDLQPEHIIIHPDSGRLSGIIDWAPALGDPAQDFSFIAAWGGWEFTRPVLEAYQNTLESAFLDRLLFLGRVRALGWLAYELQKGLDTQRTESIVRGLLAKSGSH